MMKYHSLSEAIGFKIQKPGHSREMRLVLHSIPLDLLLKLHLDACSLCPVAHEPRGIKQRQKDSKQEGGASKEHAV